MVRNIVLCLDLSDDSIRSVEWFISNVFRPGDVAHVVHSAKLKDETPDFHHGPVGTSFHYRERTTAQTEAELANVKAYIAEKINPLLDNAGIEHHTHLFLEGEKAPAAAVAATIEKVVAEVKADLIIASRSNKTWKERWFLGSVAQELAKLPYPLILVTTTPSQ